MAWYGVDKDGKTVTAGRIGRRDGMIALLVAVRKFGSSKIEALDDTQLEGLVRSLGANGYRLAESEKPQSVGKPFRVA